jgi:hypothetical protein
MNGSKTDARLRHAARTVANIVPNARMANCRDRHTTSSLGFSCRRSWSSWRRLRPPELIDVRFIIMHKTKAHWESGAIPSPELIARVGADA